MDPNQISPDQIAQIMGLSVIPDEQRQLEQQLMLARELRKGPGTQHTTGMGAALGGVGDIIRNLAATLREGKLHDAQKALIQKALQGRNAAAGALNDRGMLLPALAPGAPAAAGNASGMDPYTQQLLQQDMQGAGGGRGSVAGPIDPTDAGPFAQRQPVIPSYGF